MALKKWGEVKNERSYNVAILGAVLVGVLGFIIAPANLKVVGLLTGFVLGFIIGHSIDPIKTIIYKDEDDAK